MHGAGDTGTGMITPAPGETLGRGPVALARKCPRQFHEGGWHWLGVSDSGAITSHRVGDTGTESVTPHGVGAISWGRCHCRGVSGTSPCR